jgi:hypothetical protein
LITFGTEDPILSGDLTEYSAISENSYDVGWPKGGVEARTFLVGAEKLDPDQVEGWRFYTVDQKVRLAVISFSDVCNPTAIAI